MPYIYDSDQPLRYSRDYVIHEITSFYAFLTNLYIPSSALRFPPAGGWLSIDAQSYSFLKKNETVIDLMRHLPYITREESQGAPEIYPLTAAVDYEGEQMRRAMRFAEERGQEVDLFAIEPDAGEGLTTIPANMLVLASETSGADGFWFLLDTDRGTMTLYDGGIGWKRKGTVENEASESLLFVQDERRGEIGDGEEEATDMTCLQPVEEGVNDGEHWRYHATWRVKEFVEMLKEQYRKLELV